MKAHMEPRLQLGTFHRYNLWLSHTADPASQGRDSRGEKENSTKEEP